MRWKGPQAPQRTEEGASEAGGRWERGRGTQPGWLALPRCTHLGAHSEDGVHTAQRSGGL